jgi:hypothetical protein
MPIHYALYKNEKIAGENCYVARVHSIGTLDREEFIRRMLQAGTTFTESDIIGLWYLMQKTALHALADGWNVTTPFGIIWVSIQGLFKSFDDRFDSRRHKITLQFKVSADMQKEARHRVHPKRIEARDLGPHLVSYLDVCTGRYDSVLTPGRLGRLYGKRLKFDPRDPLQGIFFLGADGQVTPVEEVAENRPGTLIFLIPPLPIGPYRLAVRASYSGSPDLDVGLLDDVLQVAPPELLLEEPDRNFANKALRLLQMGPAPEQSGES